MRRKALIILISLLAVSAGFAVGEADPSFNQTGTVLVAIGNSVNEFHDLAVQRDGKIVAAGYSFNGSDYDIAVARFNPNGSLDPAFDGDGTLTTDFGSGNDYARALALQTDGKIIVAGSSANGAFFDFALVRYNADGSLDRSFGTDGKVRTQVGFAFSAVFDIAIDYDGSIIAVGEAFGDEKDAAIVRYDSKGRLDLRFDNDGIVLAALVPEASDSALSVAIQPDGKIVFCGYSTPSPSLAVASEFVVVRLNRNGAYDASFDGDGKAFLTFGTESESAGEVVLQSDGKLIISGRFGQFGGNGILIRLLSSGALDTTFATDGSKEFNNEAVNGHTVQPDGKILVARRGGTFPDWTYGISRFTSDGETDADFGNAGTVTTAFAGPLALQPDGKILNGSTVGNSFAISRFLGDSPIAPTADIWGQVVDSNDRPVRNARVTIVNAQTGETRIVSSNQFGYFRGRGLVTNDIYRLQTNSKANLLPELSLRLFADVNGLVVAAF
ncbi:MAG: carboxypeptidase regulatory-like domain-containing protein [Acidobacteria bacterium]|nr:carboxypeptidase regulatory-like domain-containing protein [Acidobacteriota bacterium]